MQLHVDKNTFDIYITYHPVTNSHRIYLLKVRNDLTGYHFAKEIGIGNNNVGFYKILSVGNYILAAGKVRGLVTIL